MLLEQLLQPHFALVYNVIDAILKWFFLVLQHCLLRQFCQAAFTFLHCIIHEAIALVIDSLLSLKQLWCNDMNWQDFLAHQFLQAQ